MEELRVAIGMTSVATFIAFLIFMFVAFHLKRIPVACGFGALATFLLSFQYSHIFSIHARLRGWSEETASYLDGTVFVIMLFIFFALFVFAAHSKKRKKNRTVDDENEEINLEKR